MTSPVTITAHWGYGSARIHDQAVIRMCVDREPPDLSDTAVEMLAMCSNALKFDPLAEIKERFAREDQATRIKGLESGICRKATEAAANGTYEIRLDNEEIQAACSMAARIEAAFNPANSRLMGCKVTLSP